MRFYLFVSLLISSALHAKVINVMPGLDTLQQAIVAAGSGDILILQPGTYTDSNDLTIDRSITLRSASSTEIATIALQDYSDEIYLTKDSNSRAISVTLQGVKFVTIDGFNSAGDHSEIKAATGAVEELNILESTFVNTSVSLTTDNHSASIRIIGNTISNGFLHVRNTSHAYVAANTVTGKIDLDNNDVNYVVANKITCKSTLHYDYTSTSQYNENDQCTAIEVVYHDKSYVIANHIHRDVRDSINRSGTQLKGMYLRDGTNVVASNLITYSKVGELTWLGEADYINAIWIAGGVADVFNNIIDIDPEMVTQTDTIGAIEFASTTTGNVQSNIILNHSQNALTHPEFLVNVDHNLCFGNAVNCGTDNGNLEVSPNFVDLTYQLDINSPAIDAGFDSITRSDLDKSRADMGIHGGPFGYDQYATQRESSVNPFVFPIFDNVSATSNNEVNVSAIAISRLK